MTIMIHLWMYCTAFHSSGANGLWAESCLFFLSGLAIIHTSYYHLCSFHKTRRGKREEREVELRMSIQQSYSKGGNFGDVPQHLAFGYTALFLYFSSPSLLLRIALLF